LFSVEGWLLAYSPNGRWLAVRAADDTTVLLGLGDFTVRLWDTAPLKARYQARRAAAALRPEAERLVEALWRQKTDPIDVVEALRTDRQVVRARTAPGTQGSGCGFRASRSVR
jgi:hypothetical protein